MSQTLEIPETRKTSSVTNLNIRNSVIITACGSMISQGILLLSTPLVTRLYSPATMGQVAAFTSVISILSVAIALNYEIAIPLARNDREASSTFSLAVILTLVVSALVTGVLFLGGNPIFTLLQMPTLGQYLYFIPCLLILLGTAKALSFWIIREKAFRLSSTAKVGQSLSQAIVQVSAGLANPAPSSLIFGQMAAQLGFIGLASKSLFKNFSFVRPAEIIASARKHYRFPLITIWSSLLNIISVNLPSLALLAIHGASVSGYFALCFRVLQMPVNFIGASVSQVIYSAAVEAKDAGNLQAVVLGCLKSISAFALPVFATLFLIAPGLFPFLFGPKWVEAGGYARVLVPWIVLSLYSTSLSILVSVLDKQGKEFGFQLLYLTLTGAFLFIASSFGNPLLTIGAISLSATLSLGPKIIWLLAISEVNLRVAFFLLLRELTYALPLVLLIFLAQQVFDSQLVIIAIASIAVLGNIAFNYKVRRCYEFEH